MQLPFLSKAALLAGEMANFHKLLRLKAFCIPVMAMVLIFHQYSSLVEGNFSKDMYFDWTAANSGLHGNGDDATLVLDQISGSGMQSKNSFLFGSVEMLIKLVPGNSAGTVTAYYLSSSGKNHDEIDFEFLGNISGQPYIIHTNIYTQGAGGREQQFYPWFDPTADYHNYTIHWNPSQVVWFVDTIPIRVYRNYLRDGIPYPNKQPMRVHSSIWNADSWATRNGDEKIDWTKSPFIAKLRHFSPRACKCDDDDDDGAAKSLRRCSASTPGNWWNSPAYSKLSSAERDDLNWVRKNHLIYDYCKNYKRYNGLMPGECLKPQ